MKGKNYKKVIDLNKQGNGTNNTQSFNVDELFVSHLTDQITHEDVNRGDTDATVAEEEAKSIIRRSSPTVYLTGFRMMYRFELANDEELAAYGEGYSMRIILARDKYDPGVPPGKEMFNHSLVYQNVEDSFGNEKDFSSLDHKIGVQQEQARNFASNNHFFDRQKKIGAGLNTKRYTKLHEWNFKFKRRFVGDEQVVTGVLMYNFKHEKLTFSEQSDRLGQTTEPLKTPARPTKRYVLLMYYERANGNSDKIAGFPPIKVKMHGFLYWKDEAPFQKLSKLT